MALTDMGIVVRSLRVRLFSTATTVALVGVSVALMLTILSMREAGRRAFERGTGNMHILVSADASPLVSVLNSVFYARAPQRALEWTRFEQIASDPRVDWAIPVQQGDSFRGFPTMATTPEFFTKFKPDADTEWKLAAGAFFGGHFDVVMGATAARETGVQVGEKIVIAHGMGEGAHGHDEHAMTVAGVLEPTGSAHDRAVFISVMSTWLIHAEENRLAESADAAEPTPENLLPAEKQITGAYIAVKGRAGSSAPPMVPVVFNDLRKDPSITVALPGQEIGKLFTIVSNIDQVFVALAAAVLVCSGFAVMLALYNSMDQRRRQIAVLRVLGASRARVFGLILSESAVIGLAGAAAGVLICLVGVQMTASVMKARLGLVIDAAIDPRMAIVVAGGTLLLACVAGLVPAVMGYRTSVARSLRPFA
ncbi:MAG: ABC transporter permease [Phycisphaerales bacterium]